MQMCAVRLHQVPEEDSIRVLLPQRQAGAPRVVAQGHVIPFYIFSLPTAHHSERQRVASSLSCLNHLLRELEHLNSF